MYLLQMNDRGNSSQGMLLDYLPVKNCFKASIKYATIPEKVSTKVLFDEQLSIETFI